MDHKTAGYFDQELLDIFDGYVHGDFDRRGFLDRAAKFAVGGITAAALLEALSPNYALANQIDRSEEHTSELQSRRNLVSRPLLE